MGLRAWLRGRTDAAPAVTIERPHEAVEPHAPKPGPSDVYLSAEEAAHYFQRDGRGRLPVRLREIGGQGWFVHPGTGRRVGPGNRALDAAGLHTFNVRGDSYRQAAATAGDTSPRARAYLVREPDNEHDPNAIAVQACKARGERVTVGYVNKALAKRLARRLDAGEDLRAVFIRGSLPRRKAERISVAISDAKTISRL